MPDAVTVDVELLWPPATCGGVVDCLHYGGATAHLAFHSGHFAEGVRVQWHSATTATLQIACAAASLWVQYYVEVLQSDELVATRVGTCEWSGSCRMWRFQSPQPVIGVSQVLFAAR